MNVVLVYEDCGTGLRAKHSLDLLPAQFGPEAGIHTRLWRCDLLRAALLAEQAAIEAAEADVIILSFHGRGELPLVLRECLSRWLEQKEDRPYALGVLLDAEAASQGGHHPVIAYAQQVAAAAGADLFYGFCDASDTRVDSVVEEFAEGARTPPWAPEALRLHANPNRGWGINE